jgi:tRNA-dihydrouridine synthase
MGFSGHSFWERIARVKEAISIPVIGNGDIVEPDDAVRMLAETGCDSIMIGRAARGNPWLFEQVKRRLEGRAERPVTARMRRDTILEHIRRYRRTHGEQRAARELKGQVGCYFRGTPHAAAVRARLFAAGDAGELEAIVEQHFRTTEAHIDHEVSATD